MKSQPRTGGRTLSPNTTAEENLNSADERSRSALTAHGQRRVNIMWETTQAVVAGLLVTTACWSILKSIELPPEFWMLVGLIVNAYFQRTNHTKVGGVPDEKRRGE